VQHVATHIADIPRLPIKSRKLLRGHLSKVGLHLRGVAWLGVVM
jgi:hypothetical protein